MYLARFGLIQREFFECNLLTNYAHSVAKESHLKIAHNNEIFDTRFSPSSQKSKLFLEMEKK